MGADEDFFVTYRRKALETLFGTVFRIQSYQRVSYRMHLDGDPIALQLRFLVITTGATGCCFFDEADFLTEDDLQGLIGEDALHLEKWPRTVQLSALDSAYGTLRNAGGMPIRLGGHPAQKARSRANVVAAEAKRLLRQAVQGKPYSYLCIGVVGNIVYALQRQRLGELALCDLNVDLIGRDIWGAVVLSGESTLRLVSEAKVAIVTGMTLGNGTFEQICSVAKSSNTKLLVYAQTAANMGPEMQEWGVNTVISEPYPFYNVAIGRTDLFVYRDDGRHPALDILD